VDDVKISKVMSHALRHEPWIYELELDDQGFTPVDELVDALRRNGPGWEGVTREDVARVVAHSFGGKKRFEVAGDRIRALYGHSLPGKLRKELAEPPARLFHGTSPAAAALIAEGGLLPSGRQYVHLSSDRATAVQVGRRKARDPVILVVDAARAFAGGVRFYVGNENVWLADAVPAAYVGRE
jgi:putative RNA 2'-phosphotransferase